MPSEVIKSSDEDADGEIDSKGVYTYNDQGRQLTFSAISLETGQRFLQEKYLYDSRGNRIEENSIRDGQVYNRTVYEYDDNNNLLSVVYDRRNDGITDKTETYTYSESGEKLSERIETLNHPTVDPGEWFKTLSTYSYDAKGRLLTVLEDSGIDGVINYSISYAYNDKGKEISISEKFNLDDPDLTSEIRETMEYRNNGLLHATFHMDIPPAAYAESIPIRETARYYQYDEKGNKVSSELFNGEGELVSIKRYRYDSSGNMLGHFIDHGGDGEIERSYVYTFDKKSKKLNDSFARVGAVPYLYIFDDPNTNNIASVKKYSGSPLELNRSVKWEFFYDDL